MPSSAAAPAAAGPRQTAAARTAETGALISVTFLELGAGIAPRHQTVTVSDEVPDPPTGWTDANGRYCRAMPHVTITREQLGSYIATNMAGVQIEFGEGEDQFTPVELLLVALGGCTGWMWTT